MSDTQNIADCYVSFWVTAISGKGGSQYDPNPNEYSFFFVPDTYTGSRCYSVSLSPHILIQKMDLWQQSSNNHQSTSFMNLAFPQEVKTEKSFNLFLKRITGLHLSSSSRVLKCTVESEKGARL